jgi:hypothetical protein
MIGNADVAIRCTSKLRLEAPPVSEAATETSISNKKTPRFYGGNLFSLGTSLTANVYQSSGDAQYSIAFVSGMIKFLTIGSASGLIANAGDADVYVVMSR